MSYILHIDGDSFFVACHVALEPHLKGKPVITGAERGIASAMSREAKNIGITRGMPVFRIKAEFPEVIILSSDYKLYSIFSNRMYNIVRRYSSKVEPYSIDECFADLEGNQEEVERLGRKIKNDLETDLGMTFSVGIAATKSLAKVASSHRKPSGFTFMEVHMIENFLKEVPIGDVWGIGWRSAPRLRARGLLTAFDFISQTEATLQTYYSKPYQELWYELRGVRIHTVHTHFEIQKSIMKTETFTSPSSDKEYIFSELSKNVEQAMHKLREMGLYAGSMNFYLKTQEFRYIGSSIEFSETNRPEDIITKIRPLFEKIYKTKTRYRKTGVTLHKLSEYRRQSLFETKDPEGDVLYTALDRLAEKYGMAPVFLSSSLQAKEKKRVYPRTHLLSKPPGVRPLSIPLMGEVF